MINENVLKNLTTDPMVLKMALVHFNLQGDNKLVANPVVSTATQKAPLDTTEALCRQAASSKLPSSQSSVVFLNG